jgi:hypothetical protein
MARPGLEPGTTTILGLRTEASNTAKSLRRYWFSQRGPSSTDYRYLRSFARRLGTRIAAGTQSISLGW